MDLNHINLPPALIADLYGSVLIESSNAIETVKPVKKAEPTIYKEEMITPPAEETLKYLGENRKHILVMVNYEDAVHLPDDDLALLVAMLTACKLTVADVAIVNRKNLMDQDGKAAVGKLNSRVVFLFGIDPISFGLPMSFPEFQLQAFSGATYLFAPPLSAYQDNPPLKRKLWDCLKRLFVI